jgi:hypothetical protein
MESSHKDRNPRNQKTGGPYNQLAGIPNVIINQITPWRRIRLEKQSCLVRAGFLPVLFIDPEDGDDILLRNDRTSPTDRLLDT